MSTAAPTPGPTVFRVALFAMLLSLWLIGRVGMPDEPETRKGEDAAVDPAPLIPSLATKDDEPEPDPRVPEATVETGSITGFVRFVGERPAPKLIDLNSDPYCMAFYAGKETPRDEKLVVSADGALCNALVYVSAGLPEKTWPAPAEPVMVRTMGCRYEPRVVTAMRGQRIEFHNMDQTLHNVHPIPKINPEFAVSAPPREPAVWTFSREEIGLLYKCDVHAWMIGHIHVMSHPHHYVTGPMGAFEIGDLPPGEYELTVWHEMKNLQAQQNAVKVKVEAGKTAMIDFTMSMK